MSADIEPTPGVEPWRASNPRRVGRIQTEVVRLQGRNPGQIAVRRRALRYCHNTEMAVKFAQNGRLNPVFVRVDSLTHERLSSWSQIVTEDEFRAATVALEREKHALEKDRFKLENSFFKRNFGALLAGSLMLVTAVVRPKGRQCHWPDRDRPSRMPRGFRPRMSSADSRPP